MIAGVLEIPLGLTFGVLAGLVALICYAVARHVEAVRDSDVEMRPGDVEVVQAFDFPERPDDELER